MLKNKKVIAIDIDEVLASFIDLFLQYHNSSFQTNVSRSQVVTFALHEVFETTVETMQLRMEQFGHQGNHLKIEPILGAVEAIEHLFKQGFKLHLITARPELIKKETKIWVNQFFPNKFTKIHHAYNKYLAPSHQKNRKWQICQQLKAKYMIDDLIENARECAENGIKVLLMDAPWNQAEKLPPNIKRVKDWKEILKVLK